MNAPTPTRPPTRPPQQPIPPKPTNLKLELDGNDPGRLNLTYRTSRWSGGSTHHYQFKIEWDDNGTWRGTLHLADVDSSIPFKIEWDDNGTWRGTLHLADVDSSIPFKIEWDDNGTWRGTLHLADVDSSIPLKVPFAGLVTGRTYQALGRRCGVKGVSGTCSDWTNSPTEHLPIAPTPPTARSLGVIGSNQTVLTFEYATSNWRRTGFAGQYYQLELRDLCAGTNQVKETSLTSGGVHTVSFAGVTPGSDYDARGRRCASTSSGGHTDCGPWGSAVGMPPPENIRVAPHATSTTELTVRYTQSRKPGATHNYEFQRTHVVNNVPSGVPLHYGGFASPFDIGGLTEGGTYQVRGRGCLTAAFTVCGFWTSPPVQVMLNKLDAPKVTVMPVGPDPADGHRQARIEWHEIAHATDYEVLKPDGTTPFTPKVFGTAHSYVLDLDDHPWLSSDEYVFSVQAKRPGSNYADSDKVMVKIKDNPITIAKGDSNGLTADTGEISIAWDGLPAGAYEREIIAWQLPAGDHDDDAWNPHDYGAKKVVKIGATSSLPQVVYFLVPQNVYAVQFNYRESDGTYVFSGRNAYAWPSSLEPSGDRRVATYPYFGHWPNRIYAYRICRETFPDYANTSYNETDLWIDVINGAFGAWNSALGNTPGSVDVDGAVRADGSATNCGTGRVSVDDVELPAGVTLRFSAVFDPYDSALVRSDTNDVYRVDAPVESIFHFVSFIDDIKGVCVFFAPGCTISPAYHLDTGGSTQLGMNDLDVDILLNAEKLEHNDQFPGDKGLAAPLFTKFGICGDPAPADMRIRAYLTVLHEAGHALGTAGVSIPKSLFSVIAQIRIPGVEIPWIKAAAIPAYKVEHPVVREAVMNYDDKVYDGDANEVDCAPHPLDVMAIWALYQRWVP